MSQHKFESLARKLESLIMTEIRLGDEESARVLMRNYALLWKVGVK